MTRLQVRRMFGGLTLSTAALTALAGCSASIACPRDRVVSGESCVCPEGTQQTSGACVAVSSGDPDSAGSPTNGGRTRDGGFVSTSDGGASNPASGTDAGDSIPPREPGTDASTGGTAADSGSRGPRPPLDPGGPSMAGGGGTVAPNPQPAVACPASCSSARCDASGACLRNAPRCGDGHVDAPTEQCDDGNGSPTDDCFECKYTFCGDQRIQPHAEDCEQGLTVGGRIWNTENCSGGCRRTLYTACNSYLDCNNQPCVAGVCSPPTCPGERLDICPLPGCPVLPDYATAPVFTQCLPAPVRGDQPCLTGLARVQISDIGPLCLGRSFTHLTTAAEILEVSRDPNDGFSPPAIE